MCQSHAFSNLPLCFTNFVDAKRSQSPALIVGLNARNEGKVVIRKMVDFFFSESVNRGLLTSPPLEIPMFINCNKRTNILRNCCTCQNLQGLLKVALESNFNLVKKSEPKNLFNSTHFQQSSAHFYPKPCRKNVVNFVVFLLLRILSL